MKCQKCNEEMEKGFMSSSGFAPGPVINKKIFWYSKKGIISPKDKLELGNDLETFLCKNCKVLLSKY